MENSARFDMNNVAITGIGVMAPGGIGKEKFWKRITRGNSAVRKITLFDTAIHRTKIAAECDLSINSSDPIDRCISLAIPCIYEALDDSNLPSEKIRKSGMVVGNAVGATITMENIYRELSNDGKNIKLSKPISYKAARDAFVPSGFAHNFSREIGLHGPCFNISNGCTSGIDSLGTALNLIRAGIVDSAIAIAVDAPISPITLACFDAIRATNSQENDVESASRPYDRTRSGLVLGEGAACIILEKENDAIGRGAKPYAIVGSHVTRMNAYHMTGLRSDAKEMSEAIESSLLEAKVSKNEIDYINGHGSSTRQNDLHESNAYKKVFGAGSVKIPISSVKGIIGHSLGAVGLIELAACAIALRKQIVPPTANLWNLDPELGLDFVPNIPRVKRINNILKVGSGFGGFQSATVLCSPTLG